MHTSTCMGITLQVIKSDTSYAYVHMHMCTYNAFTYMCMFVYLNICAYYMYKFSNLDAPFPASSPACITHTCICTVKNCIHDMYVWILCAYIRNTYICMLITCTNSSNSISPFPSSSISRIMASSSSCVCMYACMVCIHTHQNIFINFSNHGISFPCMYVCITYIHECIHIVCIHDIYRDAYIHKYRHTHTYIHGPFSCSLIARNQSIFDGHDYCLNASTHVCVSMYTCVYVCT